MHRPKPTASLIALVIGLAVAVAATACGGDTPTSGAIEGTLFVDADNDGVHDPDEAPLPDVMIFEDRDGDREIDANESSATTDANGAYTLQAAGDGELVARLPFGYRTGAPAAGPISRPRGDARIIGGSDADVTNYPFAVRVGDTLGDFCGGTLLSDRFVVTAAHCSTSEEDPTDILDPSIAQIWLGETDGFALGAPLSVARVEVHPEYTGDPSAGGHDIAVWELSEPIDLGATNRATIELLSAETETLAAPGTMATIIGWGVNERETSILQEVHIPIIDNNTCASSSPAYADLDTTELCAALPEGGVDSCQGDSGGPLMVLDGGRGQWVQAGVVSWGIGCAEPQNPGVYARVSALSAWAEHQARELAVVDLDTGDIAVVPSTRPLGGVGSAN